MILTLTAAAVVAVIGGVVITILLYYHKQTHVVWVTYFFLMAALLPFFWAWHQFTLEQPKPEEKKQTETPKTESPKPPTPTPTPIPTTTTPDSKPTPPEPQASDDYQPTDNDIRILAQVERGVAWESELARVLNLEPSQVNNSLRLLERHEYIRLVRPEGRAPYYQITQKGVDRLDKLHYKASHPSAEPPPKPSSKPGSIKPASYTPKNQPPPYKPDELAKKILRYIYRDEGINPVEDLSEQLKVDPLEIDVRLNKLIDIGYVNHNEFALLHSNNPYSLSDEGKEYLLQTPNRTIPFPTGPPPRVFLYVNAYHPDDLENSILRYMYSEDTPRLLRQIAEKFGLNSHEARYRMNRLREGGYVAEAFDRERREAYLLRDEGVEYILWLKPNDA